MFRNKLKWFEDISNNFRNHVNVRFGQFKVRLGPFKVRFVELRSGLMFIKSVAMFLNYFERFTVILLKNCSFEPGVKIAQGCFLFCELGNFRIQAKLEDLAPK